MTSAAERYARIGWHVFPLHSPNGSECSCGNPECSSPAKHPRTLNGLKGATTDVEQIEEWRQMFDAPNVGIRTGEVSGIVVLDVDPRHGGDKSLDALQLEHGTLPDTVTANTGGGGTHLFFKYPEKKQGNRSNIRPGLDVRGDDGYIVAVPSRHISGGIYEWPPGKSPDDIAIADAPEWLLALMANQATDNERPRQQAVSGSQDELTRLVDAASRYAGAADGATEGSRNLSAFNLAGHLAAFETEGTGARLSEEEIITLVSVWNLKNSPPLSASELTQAVGSALTNGTPRAPHIVVGGDRPSSTPQEQPTPPAKTATTNAKPQKTYLPFEPFPVHALPKVVADFARVASRSIGCDISFLSLSLLVSLASAVGNSYRLLLKRGYSEPCIFWGGLIADSGTAKSPAIELALKPLRNRQHDAMRDYAEQASDHKVATLEYKRDLSQWQKKKDGAPPPEEPEAPTVDRCWCDDVTIEKIGGLLQEQPRGLLMVRDELAAWLLGLNQYKGGKGNDSAKWLEMHGGRSVIIDRKTSGTIYIPSASVSILGGIQPATLQRALGREHLDNGLAARLLVVQPPRKIAHWIDDDIPPSKELALARLFDRLFNLEPETDDSGDPRPKLLRFTAEGHEAWVEFFNSHADEQTDMTGDLSASWSKLRGYAARFAMLIHLIRRASGDALIGDPERVDEDSVHAGATLARWFGHEARRILDTLGESEDDRDRRGVLELIERRGGEVTANDLRGASRNFPDTESADAVLSELVKAGCGEWITRPPGPQGGRPTRVFKLTRGVTVTETPKNTEVWGGFGDSIPENGPTTTTPDADVDPLENCTWEA